MKPALALSVAFLALEFVPAEPAQAGEPEGVWCPTGFTAQITNSNRALKCVRVDGIVLGSTCPKGAGMTAGAGGLDTCVWSAALGGIPKSPEPSWMSGGLPWHPPASSFRRIIRSGSGDDTFVATDFRFPEGGPIYVGNPASGVSCPSGFDGDVRYNGLGIRCDRNSGGPKEADCDPGWIVDRDRNGKEDRCLGINEGPTKAMGMTKIQFDIDRAQSSVAWILDKRTGTDLWQRRQYAYPAVGQ